jgi:hypothetical protein
MWHSTCHFTYFFLIADTLHKHSLGTNSSSIQDTENMLTTFLGAVGGIKSRHTDTIFLHVLHQVSQRSVTRHMAGRRPLFIAWIVKRGGHVGTAELTTVVAHVENLRRNVVKKREKATNALGNVRLSGRWKPHHDNDELITGSGADDFQWSRIFAFWQTVGHGVVHLDGCIRSGRHCCWRRVAAVVSTVRVCGY